MVKYKFTAEDFEKPEVPISNDKNGRLWKKPLCIAAVFALLCGAGYGGYLLLNQAPKDPVASELMTQKSDTAKQSSSVAEEHDNRPNGNNNQGLFDKQENNKSEGSDGTHKEQIDDSKVKDLSVVDEEPPIVDADNNIVTLEQKAKKVIRGDFGNGQVRKDKLIRI